MRCNGAADMKRLDELAKSSASQGGMKNFMSTVMNLVVIAWPLRTDEMHSSKTEEFVDQTFQQK